MYACGLWNLPVAWHKQACVIEDNFPPHRMPGSTHKHTHTCTHIKANCAAQCRTKVYHTVPHAAMLFFSHAAPEQMADGREGENNFGHGWQTPLIRVSLNQPVTIRRTVYVHEGWTIHWNIIKVTIWQCPLFGWMCHNSTSEMNILLLQRRLSPKKKTCIKYVLSIQP